MLNKLDFTKKFELVVKQEIKNFQDSYNALLQSQRDLKDNIDLNKEVTNKTLNALIQRNINLENEVSKLKDASIETNLKYEKALLSIESTKADLQSTIKLILNQATETQKKVKNDALEVDGLKTLMALLQMDIRHLSLEVNDKLTVLQNKVTDQITEAKTAISQLPCPLEQKLLEIEKRMCERHVDLEGLLRELKIFKKEHYIIEKKIEQLYTQIERLQKLGDKK